jgi:CO dehydrogenase nickel-insertion accessory protein CooC1
MDNEAGLEHVARGTLPRVDMMLLVSDCSRRGVQAAARVAEIVEEMNLNPGVMGLIINRAPEGKLDDGVKAEVEKQQKQAVISKYTELLDEDVLNTYSENLDKYTAKDLDKELAYELVSANQSVFTNGGQNNGFIPKEEPAMTGLEEILSK